MAKTMRFAVYATGPRCQMKGLVSDYKGIPGKVDTLRGLGHAALMEFPFNIIPLSYIR